MGKQAEKTRKKQCHSGTEALPAKDKCMPEGSISLFSALTFFLILALLFGLLESSRVYGLYANAWGKSELGVVSAYSNYAAEMAEEFGILLFWEDGGTLEDTLISCLQKQISDEDNLILSLSSPSVDVSKKIYLTEEGGIYFLKQVTELVPYRVTGEAISDILTLGDIQSQMSVINDFTQMVENAQENFTDIGEALESLETCVSSIRSMKSVVENALDSVKSAASAVESLISSDGDLFRELLELWEEKEEAEKTGSGSDGSEEESDSLDERIEALYAEAEEAWNRVRSPYETAREELLQLVKSVQTSIDSALEAMETFESLQETAAEALESMEELLDTYKDLIPSAMYSELLTQVRNMQETFTITETDTYGRTALKNALTKAEELAASLVTEIRACEMPEFTEAAETVRGKTWDEAKQYLKELAGQAGSSLKDAVLEFTESLSEAVYNSADTESADSETEGLSAGILETILNLANDGIYALVLEDASSVSTLTASLSELPSMTSKTTGSDQRTFLKSTWNRALMAAYCRLYFGSYENPSSDSLISYEMEYILGGSASDRTNLSTVMGEIFLIREGLNYAYLLTDSAKMQEAGAVALAIATAAGLPVLKIPIQMLLLAAWAAAESVCDLQQLYRGESVPLVKTSANWNLSLENLADVAGGTVQAGASKSTETSESGYLSFDYETYLMILLLLQDGQTQTWRMMDVMQMRMQKSVRSDFRIKDCVVSTEGTVSWRSAALFSDTWVLKQLLSVPSDYTIETAFSYGYVE
ncbi:MAG: DUF5702 domain-containing protein [Lachnospiraceae bacterium]|nr:DUF5702 domain-containing protein [Lachnospiraceae bacterium]